MTWLLRKFIAVHCKRVLHPYSISSSTDYPRAPNTMSTLLLPFSPSSSSALDNSTNVVSLKLSASTTGTNGAGLLIGVILMISISIILIGSVIHRLRQRRGDQPRSSRQFAYFGTPVLKQVLKTPNIGGPTKASPPRPSEGPLVSLPPAESSRMFLSETIRGSIHSDYSIEV